MKCLLFILMALPLMAMAATTPEEAVLKSKILIGVKKGVEAQYKASCKMADEKVIFFEEDHGEYKISKFKVRYNCFPKDESEGEWAVIFDAIGTVGDGHISMDKIEFSFAG
jgi:hypothetical protein